MTLPFQEMFDLVKTQGIVAGIVFLRVGAVMALLPGFGERMVPPRIRLAVALAFTAIVAPAVGADVHVLADGSRNPLMILASETMVGLALGLVLRLFVLVLEMAGTLAAQSSSLSQMFGGAGEPAPVMSHFLVMAGLGLAFLSGLHVRIASALILSYDALPAGQIPRAALMRDWGLAQIARAFAMAFSLAAPFVIGALIYNVALGVINKAMPSLMVTFIGAPALTAGALILLAVTAPLILLAWNAGFTGFLADPFTVPR